MMQIASAMFYGIPGIPAMAAGTERFAQFNFYYSKNPGL